MRKIKIFQFPIRNSNGGVTHYAMTNWQHLNKDLFECDFGTVSKHLDFEDTIKASGANVRYISCYAEENQKQFADEVKNILWHGKYDIVHLHTNWWKSFLVEEIARECGIPKIIVHSHNTKVDIDNERARLVAEDIHQRKRKEFNTSLATDFWACSTPAANWLFGEQIPRDRIELMKNAIEVEKFIFNRDIRKKYRQELGLEGCFVIGHVGRFCFQKNHEFLLRVFAKVRQRQEKARLVLVGGGELEPAVRRQAEELNIKDSVLFLGPRNDVQNILQAMDVFCLPSRFEGLPIVLIEAQSAGLKCISSDIVTQEVGITDNIRFLPLAEEYWERALLNVAEGYERTDMYDVITAAGYNIKHQIKKVESLYTTN